MTDTERVMAHLRAENIANERAAARLHEMPSETWDACIRHLRSIGYGIKTTTPTSSDTACNETGYWLEHAKAAEQDGRAR